MAINYSWGSVAMRKNLLATSLSHALACATLTSLPVAALAQTTQAAQQMPDGASEAKQLDTIVVQGEIDYRDRTDDIAPELTYDLEYFQPF